jgi:hypothetical protein
MPKVAFGILMIYFDIGNGCLAFGAPVDYVIALIYQPLVVQVHKHFPHSLRAAFIHGKPFPAPITGRTQQTQLFGDTAAVQVLPLPDPLHKFFPTQVITAQSLLSQCFFYLSLGSYTGMIRTGKP